tara:strand:- start:534 stop:680 length:147 start_codon:yes stop_codon:yes gene_type:complete
MSVGYNLATPTFFSSYPLFLYFCLNKLGITKEKYNRTKTGGVKIINKL